MTPGMIRSRAGTLATCNLFPRVTTEKRVFNLIFPVGWLLA